MSEKSRLTMLLALMLVLAACSGGGTETADETGTTEADAGVTEVEDEDTSTVTGDLLLVASSMAFEQTELTAPADGTFTIEFNNDDEGVPHNVQITDADDKVVFEPKDGETITGVASTVYNVENLEAGEYGYNCQVHPSMKGTLTVG